MNCLEFRRRVLTEPGNIGAEAIAHRQQCSTCHQFDEQIRRLDRGIYEALNVDVPEGLGSRVLLNQSLDSRRHRQRHLRRAAIAASILVILGVVLFQMPLRHASLDQAVVSHIEGEVDQVRDMSRSGPVDPSDLRKVLHQVRADIHSPLGNVVFAENCIIDGKLIAHFVVEDAGRQYTVILVPWQDLDHAIPIDQAAWRGMITPHATGSLAVVADAGYRDPEAMQRIMDHYRRSLVMQGA